MAAQRQRGVYIPQEPGKRHEPMVGPGVSVWAVISYLKAYDWDVNEVLNEFQDVLSREDILAAQEYYRSHIDEIEAVLAANRESATR